jgi:hypothetical protein
LDELDRAPLEEEGPALQTSIYLTAEDRKMVEELQRETGLKRSPLIRLALQRMYFDDYRDRSAKLLEIAEELRRMA